MKSPGPGGSGSDAIRRSPRWMRRVTRHLLTRQYLVPVMSYQELAPEFNVQPLGSLTKGNQAENSIGESAERLKLGAGAG